MKWLLRMLWQEQEKITKNPAFGEVLAGSPVDGESCLGNDISIANQNSLSSPGGTLEPGEGVAPSVPCIPRQEPNYIPGSSSSYQFNNRVVKNTKRSLAIAVLIFVFLAPTISHASFEKSFASVGSSLFSAIEASVDTTANVARSIWQTKNHLMSRGHQMLRILPHKISNAKTHITHDIQSSISQTQNFIERHHSMLSLSAKAFMATAERNLREQISGTHRMLGATETIKNTAQQALNSVFASLDMMRESSELVLSSRRANLKSLSAETITMPARDIAYSVQHSIVNTAASLLDFPSTLYQSTKTFIFNVKEGAKAVIKGDILPATTYTVEIAPVAEETRTLQETIGNEDPTSDVEKPSDDTTTTRYEENNEGQTIKVMERIIVKEKSAPSSDVEESRNRRDGNTSDVRRATFQDPRINTLVTNLADLTSRIDGGNAGGSPTPSNTALFNMIAQSQRIKTLDDVKITNATIEGYATSKGVSDSLATYLPLGGGHTHRRSDRNLSYALYHP